MFAIGSIVGTHGLKGELKLKCLYPELDFSKISNIFLVGQAYRLESFRKHQTNVLIKLQGIDSLTVAEKLGRPEVLLNEKPAALVFAEELLGKQVVSKTGVELGQVVELLDTPLYKILVVQGKKELLIPQISQFVRKIGIKIIVDVTALEEL